MIKEGNVYLAIKGSSKGEIHIVKNILHAEDYEEFENSVDHMNYAILTLLPANSTDVMLYETVYQLYLIDFCVQI